MSDLGRVHNHLIRTHIKRTSSRNQIYDAFYDIGPCSIEVLLNTLGGMVSQATIYRTVKLFLKLGIIEEISPKLFELSDRFKQHHHYFICRQCHKRIPFHDPALEKALMRMTSRRNLTLEDHLLSLSGLCSLCILEPKAPPKPAIGINLRRLPG